jgi:predicted exporter
MPSKKESKLASIPNLFTKCRFIPLLLVIFSIIIIGINYRSFRIQNNIQELYSMSQNMLQNEITSAQVLNTGSSGWYFILKADSEEALLQKNEELSNFLTKSVDEKKLGTFLSLSQFIPSEKKQAENYHAAEKLLPLAGDQYDALGLAESPLETEKFVTDYINSYRSLENSFIHLNGGHLPSAIREAISNLWIGEIDGSYYSCLLPLHAKGEEEQFFREFAAQTDGVFFVNKVKDISSQLDILSKSMILTLALAFVFVLGILFFCYRPKLVLKIAAIPLIVTLVTTAILILCKIHLSFFPVTALVLVFGLGLDYIIYAIEGSQKTESENSSLNTFAILLSFVTTALSFGALAISTFPPVHMLGFTVFVGLSTAVLSAFCMTKK